MNDNDIQQKLEQLHLTEQEYDAVQQNLINQREREVYDLLGFDLQARLSEIEAKFDKLLEQATSDRERVVKELQAKIKADVIPLGETVKAQHYMAVYAQPKPAWDNSKLEGFALVHPEILECRTEKAPYVSIRKMK